MIQPVGGRDEAARVKVWDAFVRLSHWLIVAGFFIAYISEDDFLTIHVWAGYTVGLLVTLRVVWGIIGPRHARFSDFICRPSLVIRYAVDLLRFRAKRYLGHSPAGGAMVLALLGGLLAITWTGLVLYAVEENAGPLASVYGRVDIHSAQLERATTEEKGTVDAREDHDEDEDHREEDEFWEELHEALATLVLALVILHIAGVALASIVHRENLARSMVTGFKRSADD